ncbi:hypothetical protein OKW45_002006 [Paraburkholderia sp. WSM4175]|uniref:hypothetical protein n=1 Tax=Paraburkholderia sp. WSM4175 TaxID=2991072 RepID=UPI003D234BB8
MNSAIDAAAATRHDERKTPSMSREYQRDLPEKHDCRAADYQPPSGHLAPASFR